MQFVFFYLSIAAILIVLGIVSIYKPLDFRCFVIAITTTACSLVYETILGEYYGLYYYINEKDSIIYIVLSGILLYPALNVIYVLFLPKEIKKAFVYTVFWMATMIIFEYVSLLTKTIVFTGWKPMPWSLITYIGTYLWVYTLYKFMERKKYFQESY